MASWEEIKKLAADLHRVQLGDAAKKLSERNCIEIVANLIENGQIHVVHSIDGKDYVTTDYLKTQIANETIANGGRINLADLQQILNVHYQTIEDQAQEVVSSDSELILCLGQLISTDYFNKVFAEIDEKLQEDGRLTFSQITKCYDLPTDLLQSEVYAQLGQKIRGRVDVNDRSVIYTESYVQQQSAILRGSLSALTRPMAISKLLNEIGVEGGLFFSCYDQLSQRNEIRGNLTGGRHIDRAVFVPDVFVERSERYLKDFYHQNNYIELAFLKKLNVSDLSTYLNKLFGNEAKSLIHLKEIIINKDTFDQIDSAVEDSISRHFWADITTHLPFSLSSTDQRQVTALLHKKHFNEWTTCGDILFYKEDLATALSKHFDPLIAEKAVKEAPNLAKFIRQTSQNASVSENVESKKGKATGKSGRKAKGQRGRPDEDDDDSAPFVQNQFEFMTKRELVKSLEFSNVASNCPEEILNEICDKLQNSLNAKYRTRVESVFLTAESANLKKSHGEFGERFRFLFQNICLFDAGTMIFNDSVSEQLRIYLLKSLVTDLVHLTIGYYAHVPNALQMSTKVRDATIDEMSPAAKICFQKLVGSLNGKDLTAFYDAVEEISAPNICSLNVRHPDKKMKIELIERQKDELTSQLKECEDPTVGLLLSCLWTLICYSDAMVHASGKFVPQLVAALQEKAPKTVYGLILETQKLVVQQLKIKDVNSAEEASAKFNELRLELLKSVKTSNVGDE